MRIEGQNHAAADSASGDVTQDTMFLLGSDTLKSMIQNEATRPLVFLRPGRETDGAMGIKNLKVFDCRYGAYGA